MKSLLSAAVQHPTAAKVLLLALVVVGLFSGSNIQRESFPKVELDAIRVSVVLPGATPEEIEEGITIKVEEAVHSIAGVEKVRSTSSSSRSSVWIELKQDADSRRALDDVRSAVTEIANFPPNIEPPSIIAATNRQRVITVVLDGDITAPAMRRLSERVRDELMALPEVSQVNLKGIPEREIAVAILPEKLEEHGLTLEQLMHAVRGANLEVSAGEVRSPQEEILLRAGTKKYTADALANLPLNLGDRNDELTLSDVANVIEQDVERTLLCRFNGNRGAIIEVTKTDDEDTIEVVSAVRKYVDSLSPKLASGVTASLWRDRTVMLNQRIDLLTKNGILAVLLIFGALWLFTQFRLSFWVAIGLPVAVLGTAILLNLIGVTIHMISLFGMLLVSGILVDDAIVVGENVYSHLEMGKDPKTAAIDGAREVMPAVMASIMTTIIAFIPFFYMGGHIGKFVRAIPIVVICALILSFIECLFILPSHLAHWLRLPDLKTPTVGTRIRIKVDAFVDAALRRPYSRLLAAMLRFRWQTVAFGIALFMVTLGVIGGGFIKFLFFPAIDADDIQAEYLLEPGAPAQLNDQIARRIEAAADELNKQLMAETDSSSDYILDRLTLVGLGTSEKGRVQVALRPGENRELSAEQIAKKWGEIIGPLPEARWITIGPRRRGPFGKTIHLDLISNSQSTLEEASSSLKKELASYPGTYDISDDWVIGKREIVVKLNEMGRAMGLTRQQVAQQLRQGFFGSRVEVLQRGRDELEVWVRFPKEARQSLDQLASLKLRAPNGNEVMVRDVATWDIRRGLSTIKRFNRGRKITISAMVDPTVGTPEEILTDLRKRVVPNLKAAHDDLTASFEGQSRERRKMLGGFKLALPWALLGMYSILVLVFGSYAQATLVIVMIPLGLVGAVLGHFLINMPLTVLSIWGVVALSGVIVNDSIVFVDSINRRIASGKSVIESIHAAGISRFRPIVLTTITTAAGLMPLILEQSRQAQFLIPMAASLAFGLLFGTIFTLGVLPAGFACINDIRRFSRWLRTGTWPEAEVVEPKFTKV